MMDRYDTKRSAGHFGLGIAGLLLITLGAVRLHLQPGAVSLLFLIAVVFVSLWSHFISSFAVSLIAAFLLQYYFVPLFSSADGSRNPIAIVASIAFLVTAWVITAMVSRVRKITEAQLNVRFEARLAERTRIARELHDTLLQSFQALMLHFQSAKDMLAPGPAKEALEEALNYADRAILEGRNAIQGLRSSTSVSNELAEAIAALGEELGANIHNGAPKLNVSVEGKPQELHPILRDDVYRIAREALRNAFHHAKSTKVEAELTYSPRLLRIRVRDNGTGIDPGIIETGRDGHWGLQGMRERAQQIGANIEIWSRPGAGTEVDLSIPGSIAYTRDQTNEH